MTKLRLYGFDARVPLNTEDPTWTAARREAYLLSPEIRRPVSVDRGVWPPVEAAVRTDGFAPDYWAELEALSRRGEEARQPLVLVALAVLDHSPVARALDAGCRPASIDPAWTPLGWDVADSGLVSGLTNCGFQPGLDDVQSLRHRFSPALNEHGLFERVADADEFRALSDRRVPEHAPFLIHRLFIIPQVR